MISLEGLTLCTGRRREARSILQTFSRYVKDGLLPNLFPEGEREALYHTVDATLWFFHAIDRYVATTGDTTLLNELFPVLEDIVAHHVRGTHYGIGVDTSDGLIRAGAGLLTVGMIVLIPIIPRADSGWALAVPLASTLTDDWAPTVTLRPMTSGAPPKARCQKP